MCAKKHKEDLIQFGEEQTNKEKERRRECCHPECSTVRLQKTVCHQHILMPLTSLDPDLSRYSWINLPYVSDSFEFLHERQFD